MPLAPFDLLKDINQAGSSNPRSFATLGDRVFFAVNSDRGATFGELWTTDGTRNGTVQVPGILPTAVRDGNMAALDHGVVFSGRREAAHREQLWVSDGCSSRTDRAIMTAA